MGTIIQVIVFVLLPLIAFLINKYGRLLLNISVGIKRINPNYINRLGDLNFDQTRLIIRFLWSKRAFNVDEICQILGFSDDDFASDDIGTDWIVLKFAKRTSIFLNSFNNEHRRFVNDIVGLIKADNIDWAKGFLLGTEEKPIIFFQKENVQEG